MYFVCISGKFYDNLRILIQCTYLKFISDILILKKHINYLSYYTHFFLCVCLCNDMLLKRKICTKEQLVYFKSNIQDFCLNLKVSLKIVVNLIISLFNKLVSTTIVTLLNSSSSEHKQY